MKQKQRKFCPAMWENITPSSVDVLPNGIDGLQQFKIDNVCNVKDRRRVLSADGRLWCKDSTTT